MQRETIAMSVYAERFALSYEAETYRRLIAGQDVIIHCHHYNTRIQRTIEDSPQVDGAEIIRSSAEAVFAEQIRAVLRLDVRVGDDGLTHACGFLVQVTPEGGREDVERLLANLEALPRLGDVMGEEDPDGRAFADRLFDGYRWDQSAREEVSFTCRCSRERLVAILRSLPSQEREEIAEEGVPVETTCEFCRARYEIAPAELEN